MGVLWLCLVRWRDTDVRGATPTVNGRDVASSARLSPVQRTDGPSAISNVLYLVCGRTWSRRRWAFVHRARGARCLISTVPSEWVRAHYRELKLLNPGMPVAVRPADGVSPYIAARFDNGVYRSRSTAGMDTICTFPIAWRRGGGGVMFWSKASDCPLGRSLW